MTTLPVVDLSITPPSSEPSFFAHLADGGGWTTQIILVNPTAAPIRGVLGFLARWPAVPSHHRRSNGRAVSIHDSRRQRAGTRNAWARRGDSKRFGARDPGGGGDDPPPAGIAVFSLTQGGITVTEAGVPASRVGASFRVFAEASGDANAPGSIQTGLAISNPSLTPAVVNLELSSFDGTGTSATRRGTVTIPAAGHFAAFLTEIPGFEDLTGFSKGMLHVTTEAAPGITVAAFAAGITKEATSSFPH